MKKLLYSVFGILCFSLNAITLSASITAVNLLGDGTDVAPYQLATFADLNYLSRTTSIWDKHFILTANINAEESKQLGSIYNNDGKGFSPIGDDPIFGDRQMVSFKGTFDGQGHSISNLYINRDEDYLGLFGYIEDAQIQNIYINNITISQVDWSDYSGALIGFSTSSEQVDTPPYPIASEIINCFSSGNINGDDYIGGLIGGAAYTLISNSYSTVSVNGSDEIGGLIGELYYGSIQNCYASGPVTGDGDIGGLVGYIEDCQIISSYWDIQTNSQNYSQGGTGLNSAQFTNASFFIDWDFENTWIMGAIDEDAYIRPRLDSQALNDTSLIAAFLVNSDIGKAPFEVSFSDISLGSPTSWNWDFGDDNSSMEQSPNHTYNTFGVYDVTLTVSKGSENHTIAIKNGIAIVPYSGEGTETTPYEITTFEDLHFLSKNTILWDKHFVLNSDIDASPTSDLQTSYNNSGAGFSPIGDSYEDGARQKIPFTGSLNGMGHTISNLYMNRDERYLGLFGYIEKAQITKLGLKNFSLNNKIQSQISVGLFCGKSFYSTISDCYCSGSIYAYSNTGGLIGSSLSDTISNSYSIATINADRNAGGLIGSCSRTNIISTYSSGTVNGNTNIGGLLGYIYGGNIYSSFWDKQTSNQTTSDGGSDLSTPQFSVPSNFEGWDFAQIWQIGAIDEERYLRPRLKWQQVENSSLIAAFEASPQTGKAPLEVSFTDKSTGNPSTWKWDFGDGNNSTEQNPVYEFNSLGNYDVSLIISDGTTNDTITGLNSISVRPIEGEGTTTNPFQIHKLSDLHYISTDSSLWDKHFILTANIDADSTSISGTVYNNEGKGFSPIGDATNGLRQKVEFTGSFNGQEHTIQNLYINRTESNIGLFGYTRNAKITNLGVDNLNITTTLHYGGGLVGYSITTNIEHCFTSGIITGNAIIGGLVGYASSDTIYNSYSIVETTGGSNIGGLAGKVIGADLFKNCYSSGVVNGSTSGGLVSSNSGGIFESSYWDIQTTSQDKSDGGAPFSTVQFPNQDNFLNWDFENTWQMGILPNDPYIRPRLKWQSLDNSSLVASFTVSPRTGAVPLEVSFSDISKGSPTLWLWNFGDGQTSAEQNPNHTYNTTGIYDVSLIIDNGSNKDTLAVEKCVKIYLFEGEGTEENPFAIKNMAELHFLSHYPEIWDSHFILTEDINADSTSLEGSVYNNDGKGFSPIGDALRGNRQQIAFTGSFNGKGHSIKNLYINRNENYIGLLGYAENAQIDSIIISNIRINSTESNIGSLIGYDTKSVIQYCSSTGEISGEDNLGGLIGYAHQDTISNSFSTTNLIGDDNIGGLTGYLHGGIITNCYAAGSVTGDDVVGGLVGQQYWGSIINSYASGLVQANTKGGGLAGLSVFEKTVSSFWDLHTTTQIPSSSGDFMITTQFTNTANFVNWDFENVWQMGVLKEDEYIRPRLKWQMLDNTTLSAGFFAEPTEGAFPIEVTFTDKSLGDPTSWQWDFGDGNTSTEQSPVHTYQSSGYFDVMLAVGKSGFTNDTIKLNKCVTALPFAGEGSITNPFQLATLTDLHFLSEYTLIWDKHFVLIADINADSTALEGSLYNNEGMGFSPIGYIPDDSNSARDETSFTGSFNGQNHSISNLHIYRDQDNLGLFGYIENATIENLYVTDATINDSLLIKDRLGILIGYSINSEITNCFCTGKVWGDDNIGGIIGYSFEDNIIACASAAKLTGTDCVGGLAGYKREGFTGTCFSNSTVSGNQYVGGLIGRQYYGGTITNSYSISSVFGNRIVGGLAGQLYRGSMINSYSSGYVEASTDEYIGGLFGHGSEFTLVSSYWDTQTSEYPISVGGQELITEQFTSEDNFVDWDFDNIWQIGEIAEDTYYRPRLTFQDVLEERTNAIYSISPSKSLWTKGNDSISIFAYPVTPSSTVLLESDSYGYWQPDSIKYIDSLNIMAYLSFDLSHSGMFDVLLLNDTDTLRRKYSYGILDEETPFNEWMDFKELNSDIFASYVYLPEAEEIFCIIKKGTHVGYSDTWNGNINIYTLEREKIGESHYDGSDIIISLKNIEEGYYPYEILSGLSTPWDGKIKFCLQPEKAEFNEWNTGEILRPYGHDWKYFVVPENTDTLFIKSEGYGMWSTIYVSKDSINNPLDKWTFKNWGDGYTIQGFITNPKPGFYYVKYTDSAVLYDSEVSSIFWGNGAYSKDQTRTYMLYLGGSQSVTDSPMPLSITSLSSYKVGQGAVTINIEGTGFSENDTVFLEKNGINYAAEILRFDGNNIEAFFNLFDADTGKYDLLVKDLVKESIAISNRKVEIIKSETLEEEIDIQVLSRSKLRQGRWQTVVVEVTNKTLIDQIMIPLTISIPTTCEFQLPSIMNLDDVEILDSTISMSDVPIYSIKNDIAVIPFFLRYMKTGESYRFEFKIKSENQDDFSINFDLESPFLHLSNEVLKSAFANSTDCYSTCADEAMALMIDIIKKVIGVDDVASCVADIGGIFASLGYDYAKGRSLEKNADMLTAVRQYALSAGSATLSCIKAAGKSFPLAKGISLAYDIMGYSDHLIAIANCYETCSKSDDPEPKKERKKKNVELPIEMTYSTTPEDKYGPIGASVAINDSVSNHFIDTTQQQFEYRIDYWNKEDATAPAAIVYIRDTMDTDFDITTFSFTEIGFLKWKLNLEGGQYFNVNIDCRPDMPYIVNVEGTVDPHSREVYWVYTTLDPVAMALPEDPLAGFLPPIDSTGYQIGWAGFTIWANDSLPHGTEFTNQAHVNFDGVGIWGPAPKEGPYTNTFDFEPPESEVINNLPIICKTDSVEVSWSGTDNGSGIGSYIVYVDNGTDLYPWLLSTNDTTAFFKGEMGRFYTFYSIATDRVGNVEPSKETYEASVLFNNDTLTLSLSDITLGAEAGSDSLQVRTLENIPWTVSSDCDWVTITSGITGSGTANIYFNVDANTEHMTRSCNIIVNNLVFTINQDCLPDTTVRVQTIYEGDSINIGDTFYTKTGIFPTIFRNQYDCDSIIFLELTVLSQPSPILLDSIDDIEIYAGAKDSISIDLAKVFENQTDLILSYSYLFEGGTLPNWLTSTITDSIWILNFTPELADTACYNINISAMVPAGPSVSDSFNICVIKNLTNIKERRDDFGLNIYPNPTKGKVTIEIDRTSSDKMELIVLDISGKQVLNKTYLAPPKRVTFDISTHSSGIYVVRIKIGENQYSKKLILDTK